MAFDTAQKEHRRANQGKGTRPHFQRHRNRDLHSQRSHFGSLHLSHQNTSENCDDSQMVSRRASLDQDASVMIKREDAHAGRADQLR